MWAMLIEIADVEPIVVDVLEVVFGDGEEGGEVVSLGEKLEM